MIKTISCTLAMLMACALTTCTAQAADLEAFEFNDSNGVELSAAANSVNAANTWSADIPGSTVLSNGFFIGKPGEDFAASHLQIDDVNSSTTGSRYIVAEITGWEFFDNVVGEGEELRFAFLDDNTGIDGSTVTAEVRIDRNTTSAEMELRGVAVGVGSSNISGRQTLSNPQSDRFTMVLELNKTSNTYEVFYKDGSNFSRSLGIGSVAPTRNGNSLRMVVNNNYFSDFSEFLNIDRVALTDTNPLTDLLTLEVNRTTGAVILKNTSGLSVTGITEFRIASEVGSVDSSGLSSFTGTLAAGQQTLLSLSSGDPWIRNPTEDWTFELHLSSGETRSANVNFVGNGGKRFEQGDLNFDGQLTPADWSIFIAGAETDLSNLSVAQTYQKGDLDGDGVNSIKDFGLFKTAFDAANGAGSFQAMLASIPEPSSVLLLTLGGVFLTASRRTSRR